MLGQRLGTILLTYSKISPKSNAYLLFLQIKEKVIEYSEDSNCAYCKSNLSSAATGKPSNCSCYVEFSLDEQWSGDVYFYYRLTNFYQVKLLLSFKSVSC